MSSLAWSPTTFEDRLLNKYLNKNPGKLFLEVRVGGSEDTLNARRIDGVLVPHSECKVYSPGDYTRKDFKQAIDGNNIHLIEAKRTLNRNVIGQVIVGSSLLTRNFEPSEINHIALCATGETDLEWFCKQNEVEVALFPIQSQSSTNNSDLNNSNTSRDDIRKDPDKNRRNAFLSGWTDAVKGQLYKTVRKRKTHANMGNLFGWIYGDKDYDFRIDTWDRYIDNIADPESLD